MDVRVLRQPARDDHLPRSSARSPCTNVHTHTATNSMSQPGNIPNRGNTSGRSNCRRALAWLSTAECGSNHFPHARRYHEQPAGSGAPPQVEVWRICGEHSTGEHRSSEANQ